MKGHVQAMNSVLPYLLGAAMLATVITLFLGVIGFAFGGKWSAAHANKLMSLRVALQAVAIVLFALLMLWQLK
ncbi:MAG: twin transmembrane helix small protein [Defluviicoccus sp.]